MRFIAMFCMVIALCCAVPVPAQEAACSSFDWPLSRDYSWLSGSALRTIESGGAGVLNGAVGVRLRPLPE